MDQSTTLPKPSTPPLPYRIPTPPRSRSRRVAPFVTLVLGLFVGALVPGIWIVNHPTVIKSPESAIFEEYRQYDLSLNQLHIDEKVCVIDQDEQTVERRTVRAVDGVYEQVTFNNNEDQPEDAFMYGLIVSGLPTFTVDYANCPPGG